MSNLRQNLVKVDKEIEALTKALFEIELACDDDSFFIADGDDEYGQCVIDVNLIRLILDDVERAVNRKKGEWKYIGLGRYVCSECEYLNNDETAFCPRCGAIMKSEVEE